MSTYNYAPGAVHLDFHHNNISMSASTITDLVRSFMSDRAEDVTPDFSSSVSPESDSGSSSGAPDDSSENNSSSNSPESDSGNIPLFKYIHVAVTDDKERVQIHKMVYNIVRLPKMQQVCDELYKLMKDRKVLCTINPDSMLSELRRMGLPDENTNGFSDKNFAHYYRAPKIA